ncbi:MAG: 16S rRNA (guanine(527)-N(7))-methyltransferase RsmG [Alphaproteobacteria bacterium]|jgi:16S rRNA (guanine527-N7)-methyltransferase|nr:16S rRNA (guanine(527)-N(7))-methyltransferase RsmG [Alphaproteobacteria bacterium]
MNGQIAGQSVSRETIERLTAFEALLRKWNSRINLVSPSSLDDIWDRHIVDSAQIFSLRPSRAGLWVDLGSGGGLPGIVCAILAQEHSAETRLILVESDKRKSAFLTVCAQQFALSITVVSSRAEVVEPLHADIVSARALAPLPMLLPLVARHLNPKGVALLPKGKTHEAELEAARSGWQFETDSYPSLTDPQARILALKDIHRV